MKEIPGVVTTWPANIKRFCRICNKIALPVGRTENGKLKMQCLSGHVFSANPGRLETWHARRDSMINFYQRRKAWARDLLKEKGLSNPGEHTTGEFEGKTYLIIIGPRKGIRISP
jgi:hypothetical protein